VPLFRLRKTKTKQPAAEESKKSEDKSVSYPLVKIDEVYSLGNNI
jgi:hypothetical protein